MHREGSGHPGTVIRHGKIALDTSAGSVLVDGEPIDVTAGELKVLNYLMHRPGRVVSQSDLLDHIYSASESRDSNTIEVFIARLRRVPGRGCPSCPGPPGPHPDLSSVCPDPQAS